MMTTTAAAPSFSQGTAPSHPRADASPVPWSTVLPLALPLGMAAGFWTVALRTSVGAIGRLTLPFESWVRETVLLLPFFVLGVLAALTVAQRRFGRDIDGFRQVAGVSLLVSAFATAVGMGQLALSSAIDYGLQVRQLGMMARMLANCPRTCQSGLQQATLGLQVRAVLVGTAIMLVTNLILVAWVVALRGWRLRLTSSAAGSRRGVAPAAGLARTVLVSAFVGSAVIHASVVPEHLRAQIALGAFFALMTAVQLGLSIAVVVAPRVLLRQWDRLLQWDRLPPWARALEWDRLVYLACLAASVGPLVVWTWSRTVGLPFGPGGVVPEAVGIADVAVCVLEVLAAAAALVLLRRSLRGTAEPRPGVHGVRLALVLVLAVSAVGLGGSRLPWVGFDVGGASMSHTSGPASTTTTTTGTAANGPLNG